MMKLFTLSKQLGILGVCAAALAAMPMAAKANVASQDLSQTQQIDNSDSNGVDTSKGDNPPPKPPPKPGPRDGGADD